MDVVCFSEIGWNFLWQRHQQLLTRFPKDWKILFVQPSLLGALFRRNAWIFPGRVKNVCVVLLPIIHLFDRVEILRKMNDYLAIFWTRLFMRIYGFKNPALIIYEPRFSCVVGKLNEHLVLYEIIDDRPEFVGVSKRIEKNIDFLIEKSDLITVSSQYLFDKIQKKREKDIYLIGNGADVEHFKKARGNIEIPAEMSNINRPIVGYIGVIAEWLDFQLIEKMLKGFPDLSVVFIGPVFPKYRKKVNKLKGSYSNFHALGKRPYSLLPNYLKTFDVCIIPFKINELTRGVNPNKLYEYLACGKPVVSTALPEVQKYSEIVYVAKTHEEFLKYINQALKNSHDPEKFLKVAEENTWDKAAESMVELISTYSDNRKVIDP